MAFYEGKLFRVKADTKEIMHETDFEFGAAREFQDLVSKDTDNAVNPGKKTWTLSGNGYIDDSNADAQEDYDALYTWFDAGTTKTVEIADAVSGHLNFSITAYLESINLVSNVNEVLTYSYALKITAVTKGTTA